MSDESDTDAMLPTILEDAMSLGRRFPAFCLSFLINSLNLSVY